MNAKRLSLSAALLVGSMAQATDKCDVYISGVGAAQDFIYADYNDIENVPVPRELITLTIKVRNKFAKTQNLSEIYFTAAGKSLRYDDYVDRNLPLIDKHWWGGYGGGGSDSYSGGSGGNRGYENQDYELFFRNYRDDLYVRDVSMVSKAVKMPNFNISKADSYSEYQVAIPVEIRMPAIRRGGTRGDKQMMMKSVWGGTLTLIDGSRDAITSLFPRLDRATIATLSNMLGNREIGGKRVGDVALRFEKNFYVFDADMLRMIRAGGGLVGNRTMRLDGDLQIGSVRQLMSLYFNSMACGVKAQEVKPAGKPNADRDHLRDLLNGKGEQAPEAPEAAKKPKAPRDEEE